MDYRVYGPGEGLSRYIKCYWTLQGDESPAAPARERIFPDGCMEWIFQYGDLFTKHTAGGTVLQPRSFVHGQLKRYIEISPTGRTGVFSVRFRPHGLRPFIGRDAGGLAGEMVPTHTLWGEAGAGLERSVLQAETAEVRIRLVEAFLLARLDDSADPGGTVHRCVEAIEEQAGMVSVDHLAADACLGRRQLERKFMEHVGLTPKLLARIVRFNHVLRLIEQREYDSRARLAQEGGFYDQAHFVKDFRDFTGLNPATYFSEDLDLVKFFNLGG